MTELQGRASLRKLSEDPQFATLLRRIDVNAKQQTVLPAFDSRMKRTPWGEYPLIKSPKKMIVADRYILRYPSHAFDQQACGPTTAMNSNFRQAHPRFEQQHRDQLEMVRPLATPAPIPGITPGYRLRQLKAGDEKLYDDLFHLAFDDEGRFPEIQGRTLPGGFFGVEHLESQQLVASCFAFRGSSSPRHPDAGQLAWLVVDPAHTQKGLGTLVAAMATNRLMREGYRRPFLGTEDVRTAAISIYLRP